MKNHYDNLGIRSSANLAEIKKAFRQKAALYHPDRNPDPLAPALFRAVQEAYDVLSDETQRQAYDDNRRRGLLDNPQETAREIWQNYFDNLPLKSPL
ncbi:MAG: hypothetical protein RIR79_2097 [Pseudomonadota bacterium]